MAIYARPYLAHRKWRNNHYGGVWFSWYMAGIGARDGTCVTSIIKKVPLMLDLPLQNNDISFN
jgi:hypothetical protein